MKRCKRCGVEKPSEAFYVAPENRDGLHTQCKPCYRASYTSQAYQRGKAARDRAVTKWRLTNPDKARAISKRGYDKNADIMRLRTILRKRGLTLDQYHSMAENQDFCCYLCGDCEPLQVDHCHTTGRVRRMLCRLCNSALGQFRENPTLLRTAAAYVERYSDGVR